MAMYPNTFDPRISAFLARLILGVSIGFLPTIMSAAETEKASAVDVTKLTKIEAAPQKLEFHRARDQAIALVTGRLADGLAVDVTTQATVSSSNPAVAAYKDGAIVPTGNGQCEVTIQLGDHKVVLPVSVDSFEQPAPVSFRTETVAALTRQGCNSGPCHGSPTGKGGFQLSLQAFDHAMDSVTLTRGERGRRVDMINPDNSLLLLKPIMAVPHKGGLQMRTDDYAYEVLRKWVAEGCAIDAAEGHQCVQLELLPASGRVLKDPHWHQQIVAIAHFDNGAVRDVTRLTRFTSSDETIASVSPEGVLTGHRRGQVAVMARYLDQLVSCQFTLAKDIEGFQWPNPPANNYVDELVYEKLQQLQYEPSEVCTDHEFIRRVYLDVIGLLPTIEEQAAFAADQRPDRRQFLINDLLDRHEHARFWALKWGDLLRLQKGRLRETAVHKFYEWLVESFETNKPFNQFAAELLHAQGSTLDHPAANYYRACADSIEAAETSAQIFLGSRIQCAKCHNHPYENWTQNNFYGITAFFQRVSRKPGMRADEDIIYVARDGEVHQPRTGEMMKPWLPGQGSIDNPALPDRRQAFVDWLTAPANPFFSRVAVNRIWAEVMGQGIIEPVDDVRQSNPPANPPLLDRLATDFAQHGFDQKYILRTILNSRTYQLSNQPTKLNQEDTRLCSHSKSRMLTAEQLLDAMCAVTQVAESFPGLPPNTHATELPSPDFSVSFLDTFGRPARATACACERGTATTLAQALELVNGQVLQKKLADKQNRFHRQLAEGRPAKDIVDELYRAAVCRPATDSEVQAALAHVTAQKEPGAGLEDVCWALLNTNEFVTQH